MNSYFGTCNTEGDVAVKEVILSQTWPEDGETESFLISVLFDYENTVASPKIQLKNPDETNAFEAQHNINLYGIEAGGAAGAGEANSWHSGTVVTFIHTGTIYYIINYHNYLTSEDLEGYVETSAFQTTAQTHLLSGDATGAAITDSTHFVTVNPQSGAFYRRAFGDLINYTHQQAKVGFNEHYANKGKTGEDWYLVASTPIITTGESTKDYELVLYVRDGMAGAERSGILKARVRTAANGTLENMQLVWDYMSNNYSFSDFVLMTDNSTTIQLWTRNSYNYTPRIFTVIDTGMRNETYNSSRWALNQQWSGTSAGKTSPGNYELPQVFSIYSTNMELALFRSMPVYDTRIDISDEHNGVPYSDDPTTGYWPGLRFKDKTATEFATVLGYARYNGSIGVDLNVTNRTYTGNFGLEISRNGARQFYIHADNIYVRSSTSEEELWLKGTQGQVYLWGANSEASAVYANGAGLWYTDASLGRRLIDYLPNYPLDNTVLTGFIYIGSSDRNPKVAISQAYVTTLYKRGVAGTLDRTSVHELNLGQYGDVYLGSNNYGGGGDLFGVGAEINVQTGSYSSKYNGHHLLLLVTEDGFRLVDQDQTNWPTIWTITANSSGALILTPGPGAL